MDIINKTKIIVLIIFSLSFQSTLSQTDKEMYEIVSVVVNYNNPELSIVDTLNPISIRSNFLMKQITEKVTLNRKQKKILKGKVDNSGGLIIDKTKLPNFKFYLHSEVSNIFQNLSADSEAINLLNEKKPFYVFSKPVIFLEINIAFINMDLIGGFGAIYILEKKNDKWIIKDSIGKWYS